MSSTYAVEDAIRVAGSSSYPRDGEPNEVARLVRNLILGGEFIMSHITHWYTLSILDYVQGPNTPPYTPYLNDNFYSPILQAPVTRSSGPRAVCGNGPWGDRNIPASGAINAAGLRSTDLAAIWDNGIVDYLEALRWRREALAVIAPLAGRTPQFQTVVAGGVNCRPTADQCQNILDVVGNDSSGLIQFIKKNYIPMVQIMSYLYGPYGGSTSGWAMRKYDNNGSAIFSGYGSGIRNFLSFGVFNLASASTATPGTATDPQRLLRRGYIYGDTSGQATGTVQDVTASDPSTCNIREFIYGSHYQVDGEADSTSAYITASAGITPWNGYTDPKFEDVHGATTGYSWIKSPRIMHSGTPIACQVGPLARMAVTGGRGVGTGYTVLADPVGDVYTTPANALTALDAECASYRLGMSKSNVMLLHPTLKDILVTNVGAVTGLFGALPGSFFCGASVMDRHRARAYEALKIAKSMVIWATALKSIATAAYPSGYTGASANYTAFSALPNDDAQYRGRGMHEAPRGALSHWITIKNGRIDNYQCVVPTTWNAGPRHDAAASGSADHFVRGPIEQAIMGHSSSTNSVPTVEGWGSPGYPHSATEKAVPIEILRIVHSFDPCIACAVH